MRVVSSVAMWGFAPGGAERHIRSLDDIAVALNHEHEVVAAWAQDCWAGTAFACSSAPPPKNWSEQLIMAVRLLRADFEARPADLIVAHGLAPLVAAVRAGVPVVALNFYPGGLERRANWDAHLRRSPIDRLQEEALDLVERHYFRRAGAVVVLSEHGRRLLSRRLLGVDAHVIPPHIAPASSARRPRDIDLLIVRRLAPRMGHEAMLRSVSGLVRERDLSVAIVGDGPERGRLESLVAREGIRDNISFKGTVTGRELQELYARARTIAVPATGGEGFGLAALEALTTGAVPIVSDVPTLRELVAAVAPWLVVRGSAWSDALEARLALDANDEAALLKGCRQRSEAFALDHVVAQWRLLLDSMSHAGPMGGSPHGGRG